MTTRILRQDTIKSLPYLGTGNFQCIYWDQHLAVLRSEGLSERPASVSSARIELKVANESPLWAEGTY